MRAEKVCARICFGLWKKLCNFVIFRYFFHLVSGNHFKYSNNDSFKRDKKKLKGVLHIILNLVKKSIRKWHCLSAMTNFRVARRRYSCVLWVFITDLRVWTLASDSLLFLHFPTSTISANRSRNYLIEQSMTD